MLLLYWVAAQHPLVCQWEVWQQQANLLLLLLLLLLWGLRHCQPLSRLLLQPLLLLAQCLVWLRWLLLLLLLQLQPHRLAALLPQALKV